MEDLSRWKEGFEVSWSTTPTRLVYRHSRLDRAGSIVALVVLALGTVALFVVGLPVPLVGIAGGVAALLGAFAVVVNRRGVEVDEHQLVVHRVLSSQSIEWSDIAAYYHPRGTTRLGLASIIAALGGLLLVLRGNTSRFSLILESKSGKRVGVLDNVHPQTPGSPPLDTLVRERVVGQLSPDLRTVFGAGARVEFGPVSLSRLEGMIFKRKRIPLAELGDYSLVQRKGRLVLSRGKALGVDPAVRWDRVPNIDILLTLFAELKQAAPTPHPAW
ncbi:MAG TPA: hypothetical protein DCY40_03080 [Actinobacteria bacterium]|nr:hypothetical protein [Actinomycetota bacterium]